MVRIETAAPLCAGGQPARRVVVVAPAPPGVFLGVVRLDWELGPGETLEQIAAMRAAVTGDQVVGA